MAALVVGLSLGAAAAGALAEPPRAGYAPDPRPLASTKQWIFEITLRQGKMTIDRARSETSPRPIASPRMMGRYAIELYVGKELLDRVRFNVPLTGDGPPESGEKSRNPFPRPTFQNVSTRLRVQMADNTRATHAALVDRATGEVERFLWPPEPDGRLLRKPSAPPSGSAAPSAAARANAPKNAAATPNNAGADAGADAGVDAGGKPDAATGTERGR